MPKTATQSPVSGKFGKSIVTHKADEIVYSSGGNLPAGIEGGRAELVDVKIDKYKDGKNKGKEYFLARGVVKMPEEYRGLSTMIMEPLCETPGRTRESEDDHIAWVLNEIKKLAGEGCLDHIEDEETADAELREYLELLKTMGIEFRFRTWSGAKQELEEREGKFYVVQGNKEDGPFKTAQQAKAKYKYLGSEPSVNHQWLGAIGMNEEATELPVDDIVDNTSDEPAAAAVNGSAPPKTSTTASKQKGSAQPPAEEDDIPFDDDIDELASQADDNGDADAAKRLEEISQMVGIEPEVAANTQSWAELANLIAEATAKPETEEEEPEPEPEPEEDQPPSKGAKYSFTPPKKRKPIQVEVTTIFPGAKTCNVRGLEDKVVYRSIPWDSLQPA